MVEGILKALQTLRTPLLTDEYILHEMIAGALDNAGIAYIKEARLGPYARIDFLCENVGIEAKKGKTDQRSVLKQLQRYAACDRVSVIVLVTEQMVKLPKKIGGKPVYTVALNRLWGVAI